MIKNPNSTCSSPWPMELSIFMNIQRAAGRATKRDSAQIEGSLPVERVRNRTAKMSCMMSTPMAVRPLRDEARPLSSRILTAKTVEEKLRAKAARSMAVWSMSVKMENPSADSQVSPPAKMATVMTMCSPAPAQTSGRSRPLTLSLRPMENSSRVTPTSATVWMVGPPSYPTTDKPNPATR